MAQDIVIDSASFLNLRVTNSMSEFTAEKRFDRGITIAALKTRLELITGASANNMSIEVFNEKDELLFPLNNDDALLGSFTIEDNYRLHIIDSSKKQGEFEDVSRVEKFELSEESYDQRTDSVRSFLKRNKLGKYNEDEQAALKAKADADAAAEEEKAKSINTGSRCEVQVPGEPTRRGVVKFVGKTHFKEGWWVGVHYDEPLGKNDGSIDGKRYFDAPMKYGGFTRPGNVTLGDFPELSVDDEEI